MKLADLVQRDIPTLAMGSLFEVSPSFQAWLNAASEIERLMAELSCASRIPLDELEVDFRQWIKGQSCTIKDGIEHCKLLIVLGYPLPWQSLLFDTDAEPPEMPYRNIEPLTLDNMRAARDAMRLGLQMPPEMAG